FLQRSLGEIPYLKGNPAGLESAIINLLKNSIQAFSQSETKEKQIVINTYSKNHNIYIEVRDNAIGIDNKLLDRVYDPFFTTKEINEGMGLGLTMVHWVISLHNGEIEINNNSQGGLTCKIKIPY
ncbi:MAG: sensor histidine kinase, partial [Peptococcales bacterium]